MMIKMDDRAERANGHYPGKTMTCEEFQEKMPELIGADIRDHEHLQTCARCSALLTDLEIIADIASNLLLPVHEPGDVVWKKITASLSQGDIATEDTRQPDS
jgi:hypothetical protein